ncbi:unnamed protein product [Arabidopsis halleri]
MSCTVSLICNDDTINWGKLYSFKKKEDYILLDIFNNVVAIFFSFIYIFK